MVFYTPNNFKNGRLIFNRYRVIDIVVFIVALIVTFLMIILSITQFSIYNPIIIALMVFPAGVAFFLIQPFGVYHNFLEYFKLLYLFKSSKRNFLWEGIYKYEEKDE